MVPGPCVHRDRHGATVCRNSAGPKVPWSTCESVMAVTARWSMDLKRLQDWAKNGSWGLGHCQCQCVRELLFLLRCD